MTISQSVVLVLLIALWATGTGVDLTNNTTLLIILLVALIALSYATNLTNFSQNNRRACCFNYQFANNNTNLLTLLNNLF